MQFAGQLPDPTKQPPYMRFSTSTACLRNELSALISSALSCSPLTRRRTSFAMGSRRHILMTYVTNDSLLLMIVHCGQEELAARMRFFLGCSGSPVLQFRPRPGRSISALRISPYMGRPYRR